MDHFMPEMKEDEIKVEEEDIPSTLTSDNSLTPQHQIWLKDENEASVDGIPCHILDIRRMLEPLKDEERSDEREEVEENKSVPRRSQRERRQPMQMSDYVTRRDCKLQEKSDEVKTAVFMIEENEIKIEEEDVPPPEDPLALCQQGPSWKEGEKEVSGKGRKRVRKVRGSVTTTTTTDAAAAAAHPTTAQPSTFSCDVFVWNDGSEFIPDSPAFDMTNAGIQPAFQVHGDQDYVDYFLAFLDERLLQQMCEETNRYQEQCTSSDTVGSPKTILWSPLSVREMYVFLALMLLMPHVRKHELDDYWAHEDIIYTPIFGKYMSRDRFRAIYSYLHFADNMHPSDTDPLWKIREIMNIIKEKFRAFFKPMQKVVIDESLVLFRGCLSFRQYIPSKQHRFGIKFCVLCDCETGYMLDFVIYSASEVDIKKTDPLLFSSSVVKVLLERYFGENHILYTDNYYTSPILSIYLKEHGVGSVSTVRQNRKHWPVFPESRRGEEHFKKSGKMLAIRWHDKKPVNMLTTEHVGHLQDSGKVNFKTGEKIMKPDVVNDYNINMRLVDKSDMMIGFIDCLRKNCKWYKKSFLHIIDMCMLNAYILYKTQVGERRQPSLRQFSRTVITQLLERFGQVTAQAPRRHSDALSDRLEARDYLDRHYIDYLRPTGSRNVGVGRCYVCSHSSHKPKVRKQTSYKCHECDVPLCIVPCFREYHTFKKY